MDRVGFSYRMWSRFSWPTEAVNLFHRRPACGKLWGMAREVYIIEHPTRGVLQEEPNRDTGNARFAWTGPRGAEGDAIYYTLRRAIQDVTELDLPKGCQVRGSSDWEKVLWG